MLLGDILSGQMDTTRLTLLLGGVVLIVVWRLSTPTLDPREPPLLKPKIPVVGHLINMIMKGNGFFAATVYVPISHSQITSRRSTRPQTKTSPDSIRAD